MIEVTVASGRYVVAVSGGVDSVVLLDILSKHTDLELVAAHFDHGIRSDSAEDAQFVKSLAAHYGLLFELGRGNLGAGASEAASREARYKFLEHVMIQHGAKAVIVAHHQDDYVETIILNMLRKTGSYGLVPMKSEHEWLVRPLLHVAKYQILNYAHEFGLSWHEDSTNTDVRYRRNYVRHDLLPRLRRADPGFDNKLLAISVRAGELNEKITQGLQELQLTMQVEPDTYDRYQFTILPLNVAQWWLHQLLSEAGVGDLSRTMVERITLQLRTLLPGKTINVDKNVTIAVHKNTFYLRKCLPLPV